MIAQRESTKVLIPEGEHPVALFPRFFTRRDTGLEREGLQLFEHSLGHTGEQESTSRLAHLLTVRPWSD